MAPKSVLEKIVEVIKEQNVPGGSSRPALAKSLKAKYGEIPANAIKTAVKKGVDSKVLVQSGQKFWVLVTNRLHLRPRRPLRLLIWSSGLDRRLSRAPPAS